MRPLVPSLFFPLLLVVPLYAQTPRDPVRLDDPLLSNTPDVTDLFVRADGDLVAALWLDERDAINTTDDDIFLAVSQDGGLSWGAEIQVTNGAPAAIDVDNPRLEVADGVLYVCWDDDALGSTNPRAVVSWSTDFGQTWSQVVLGTAGDDPFLVADGSDVLVAWHESQASPRRLMAAASVTGPSGLSTATPVQVNGSGNTGLDGYRLALADRRAHVVWLDDELSPGEDDLWYAGFGFASGAWTAPVQVNEDLLTPDGDVDRLPRLAVAGSTVHVAWMEDDVDPVLASDDVLFYAPVDISTPASPVVGTQQRISGAPPVDADYHWLAADGVRVLITWNDDQAGSNEALRCRVSDDGGQSFGAEIAFPAGGAGPLDAQQSYCAVDGNFMVIVYEDDSFNLSTIDEVPAMVYSHDGGATWSDPLHVGSGYQPDEDVDTEPEAFLFHQGQVMTLFQSDGGSAQPVSMSFAGARFPLLELAAGPGTLAWRLSGFDQALAGQGARIGAAAVSAPQASVHPENPALRIDLVADPYLAWTTANRQNIGALIGADGRAFRNLTLPPAASGLTLHIQGWGVLLPPIGQGLRPSDVVTVTLP